MIKIRKVKLGKEAGVWASLHDQPHTQHLFDLPTSATISQYGADRPTLTLTFELDPDVEVVNE